MNSDDYLSSRSLTLSRAPAALAAGMAIEKLHDPLKEDLEEESHELPLETFMTYGGWIDTDSIEVSVDDVSDAGDDVEATVRVWFTERRQSSCADIEHEHHYEGQLSVTMDKATGEAEVEAESAEEDDPDFDELLEMDVEKRIDFDYDRSEF
jgi:hypothetical protein